MTFKSTKHCFYKRGHKSILSVGKILPNSFHGEACFFFSSNKKAIYSENS